MLAYNKKTIFFSLYFSVVTLIVIFVCDELYGKAAELFINIFVGLFTGSVVTLGTSLVHYYHDRKAYLKNIYSEIRSIYFNLKAAKKRTSNLTNEFVDDRQNLILRENPYVDYSKLNILLISMDMADNNIKKIDVLEFKPFIADIEKIYLNIFNHICEANKCESKFLKKCENLFVNSEVIIICQSLKNFYSIFAMVQELNESIKKVQLTC
ncbi:hypothetical protein QUF90_02845, partial [Desulfococcaceae bacterium HSG9]|nr:hypothetical protein [Desulfococcaceae bacterium HSG9]